MSWLIYIDKKVELRPEGEVLPEVKALLNADKSENKDHFNKVITWVYHIYNGEHPLEDLLPDERKQRVCDLYFKGEDVSVIEKEARVKKFIKVFQKDCISSKERFYQSIQRDIEDVLEHLQEIKMYHIIDTPVDVIVEHPNDSGELVEIKAKAKLPIKIDNSKEKLSAIGRARELMKLEAEIQMEVKKERQKKRHQHRMFDETVEVER